jgi:hypothetical protein
MAVLTASSNRSNQASLIALSESERAGISTTMVVVNRARIGGASAITRPPTEAALRWRPQFSSEPTFRFMGFHGINQFDDDLMDQIASRAFEGPDIKT